MIFTETRLPGVVVVELEPAADERGFFARSWCQKEFTKHGLNSNLAQCNISFNPKRGTLRGMHYQAAPYFEAKLVRCTMGSVHDVVVDIRPDSPTFKQWFAIELTAQNRKMLYMAEGFAHGYQTLEDNCEVFYQVSEFYRPELARGMRWDDPAFGIDWPIQNPILSDKDRECPFMP